MTNLLIGPSVTPRHKHHHHHRRHHSTRPPYAGAPPPSTDPGNFWNLDTNHSIVLFLGVGVVVITSQQFWSFHFLVSFLLKIMFL